MINGQPNITIIVLDTLRLDEFRKLWRSGSLSKLGRFIVLDSCIAPAPWTLPSHASLLTGMYPSKHGAHETRSVKALDIEKIKLRKRTMVSDLKDIGYTTYCISANPYVHPLYGFDEFDFFKEESYYTDLAGHAIEVPKRLKPLLSKYRERYGGSFVKIGFAMLRDDPALITEITGLPMTGYLTFRNLLRKLRAKAIEGWPLEKGGHNTVAMVRAQKFKEPFFLFINIMEAHDPYMSGKGKDMKWYSSFLKEGPGQELVSKWKRLYAKASRMGYGYAAEIVEELVKRYGDDQVIILTSDHGQEFGEHGFIGHGSALHDEIVRVPLAVMVPKRFSAGKRKGSASLVNVRPFIEAVIAGDRNATDRLFSKSVYSESFGVPGDFTIVKGIDKDKLNKAERRQRRSFR